MYLWYSPYDRVCAWLGRQRIFVKRDALETEQRVEVVAEGSNEEVKKTMEVVGCGVPLAGGLFSSL